MSKATAEAPVVSPARAKAGKYLTFALGKESYGIQILKVREIIRITGITHVPCMPNYLRGVINLRGKVVPVADLRIKFGLHNTESTERTCIIVVETAAESGARSHMGLVVDSVEEVVNVPAADIEPTPDFGVALATDYILGIAKIRGAVKTLLDIDQVISASAIQDLRAAVKAA